MMITVNHDQVGDDLQEGDDQKDDQKDDHQEDDDPGAAGQSGRKARVKETITREEDLHMR